MRGSRAFLFSWGFEKPNNLLRGNLRFCFRHPLAASPKRSAAYAPGNATVEPTCERERAEKGRILTIRILSRFCRANRPENPVYLRKDNRAGEIRTRDLLNPIQAHYQAVLRPVFLRGATLCICSRLGKRFSSFVAASHRNCAKPSSQCRNGRLAGGSGRGEGAGLRAHGLHQPREVTRGVVAGDKE